MPSMIYTIFLALHATVFFLLSGHATFRVMASPVLVSPTRVHLAPNYYSPTELNTTRDASPLDGLLSARRDSLTDSRSSSPAIAAHSSTPHSLHHQDDLLIYYNQAEENSNKLKSLAKRSAHVGQNDDDFRRNCVSQASEYQINLLGLEGLLAQLGADKGLANYDRNNDVEVILKRIINLNKDTLNALAAITDAIPGIGPLLGPIVYEIKCILDNFLNFCENLTDATINALQPLLRALIGQASTMACGSNINILGFCV